ncbi:MAG: hypothetical protein IKP47_05975 [Ruminococcus sp.]|nr:hypothetical protein [Ruminococcus sp.]
MKRSRILSVILALALSSCSESSSPGYVDVSSLEEKYDSALSQIFTDTVDICDSPLVFGHWGCSYSSDSFIICESGSKESIDLASGVVSTMCDVPGCVHDENISKDCFVYRHINNPVLTREGMYFTEYSDNTKGKLFYKSGGKTETVFRNDFRSDLDRELEPGGMGSFRFFMRDGVMYVMGLNWFYTVDISSMTKTCEPVLLGGSQIFNADVYGDVFYYSNENLELYSYDMKTGGNKKLADKVWKLQPCRDGLYYFVTEGSKGSIELLPYGASESQQLLTDVYSEFYVTDESIYCITDEGTYLYNKSDRSKTRLALSLTYENGESYACERPELLKLISCPSSGYVCLLDSSKETDVRATNALFCIKKDTAEVRAISLGIYLQSGGDKGRIISR